MSDDAIRTYSWSKNDGFSYDEAWRLERIGINVTAPKVSRDKISAYVQVADIALQALATGMTIEELIAREPIIKQHMINLAARIKAQKALDTRRRNQAAKLAAKKAAEDAARAFAASKLTPEELEAFGLTPAGTRKGR